MDWQDILVIIIAMAFVICVDVAILAVIDSFFIQGMVAGGVEQVEWTEITPPHDGLQCWKASGRLMWCEQVRE